VIQTLFGTVVVDAPRYSVCPCAGTYGFEDVSISPLAELLPDRCTLELRRVQPELGARHFLREAGRLLSMLLPCTAPNHATIRNRLQQVATKMEARTPLAPEKLPSAKSEFVVIIDGAHIRASSGDQYRHLDATVGKVEVFGRPPRRFGFTPRGAPSPLARIRAALLEQGWTPGRPLTVISDGEAALPTCCGRLVGARSSTFSIGSALHANAPDRANTARFRFWAYGGRTSGRVSRPYRHCVSVAIRSDCNLRH
jgi:hypothetical protein